MERRTFSLGWMPDADAVNAPPEALLRADNLILDELGALSVRKGVTLLDPNPTPDGDLHTLYALRLNGVLLYYGVAGNNLYRNATVPLGPSFDGTGDASFGSHMGQVLVARGTTKYKDDSVTTRIWGIHMTGGPPEITSVVESAIEIYATWDWDEEHVTLVEGGNKPEEEPPPEEEPMAVMPPTISLMDWEALEGTIYHAEGYDGEVDGAIQLYPNSQKGRIIVKRELAADTDFSVIDGTGGPREATDDDIITMWVYLSNPKVVEKIALRIDVNGGKFEDFFIKEWIPEGSPGADRSVGDPGGTPPNRRPPERGGDNPGKPVPDVGEPPML